MNSRISELGKGFFVYVFTLLSVLAWFHYLYYLTNLNTTGWILIIPLVIGFALSWLFNKKIKNIWMVLLLMLIMAVSISASEWLTRHQ